MRSVCTLNFVELKTCTFRGFVDTIRKQECRHLDVVLQNYIKASAFKDELLLKLFFQVEIH
jgi:hypothetical protein